ncbi:MAG TPA: class I SAM-dependent methyltransferase [Candidatus Binatia bacterium]|nr:class I SAM-dependent methyltransferase [Candidatus Binatia bacterium]
MALRARAESENVSPTAYATGYFWYRHGLSHQGLLIPEAEKHERRFRGLIRIIRVLTGVSLDALMLARHKGIDALLARDIESGKVTQVIELAAGLSPRGWRFKQRYGAKITYIETDLPHMAQLKQQRLADSGLLTPGHRVEAVNVLVDSGAGSLFELTRGLDHKAGVAVITEGLLSYLDPDAAKAVWHRIAVALREFPTGVYLSDAYLRQDRYGFAMRLFRGAIQRFVQGRMHVHFQAPDDATRLLHAAGFRQVTLHETAHIAETRELSQTPGGDRVRVLEART